MKSLYSVVGMQYRGAAKFVKTLPSREPLRLVRDPKNPADPFAVEVWARGSHIGFVKGIEARKLAPKMDAAGTPEITGVLVTLAGWPQAEVDDAKPQGVSHADIG